MTNILKIPHISVVSPVYGCPEALYELCERLHLTLGAINREYEIILINDGSPDNSWEIIRELANKDLRVKGINLSRNFGQHNAITAGLDFARGNWVVVMDCDLQDLPEEISKLYEEALLGFDIVVGKRVERKDNWLKKTSSKIFHILFYYFTKTKSNNQVGNFGIYSQVVIATIRQFPEKNRCFGLVALWTGFSRSEIEVKHSQRSYGKSSYSPAKRIRLASDILITHSNMLLEITAFLGIFISLVSFILSSWLIIRYFLHGTPLIGWTSIIVSIYFTTGLVIGCIGILGLYVGKIFDEVKGRPHYVVSATTFDVKN
jgi:dolichol-phosphate mannosyltransferase